MNLKGTRVRPPSLKRTWDRGILGIWFGLVGSLRILSTFRWGTTGVSLCMAVEGMICLLTLGIIETSDISLWSLKRLYKNTMRKMGRLNEAVGNLKKIERDKRGQDH